MNNIFFTVNLPVIGISIVLFLFSLYLHEAGKRFFSLKFTVLPESNPLIRPDAIGTFLLPLFSVFSGGIITGFSRMDGKDHGIRLKYYVVSSIGGILLNVLFFCITIVFAKMINSFGLFQSEHLFPKFIADIFVYFACIHLMLLLINMIPVPPLDAGRIIYKALKCRGELINALGSLGILFISFFGLVKYLSKLLYNIVSILVFEAGLIFYISFAAVTGVFIFYYRIFGKMKSIKHLPQETDNVNLHGIEILAHNQFKLTPEFFKNLEARIKGQTFQNAPLKEYIALENEVLKTAGYKGVISQKKSLNDLKSDNESHIKNKSDINTFEKSYSPVHIFSVRKTIHLLNRIYSLELLNPDELKEYLKLKSLNYKLSNLCMIEYFSITRSKCKKCKKFSMCTSRLLKETDLRSPKNLKSFFESD